VNSPLLELQGVVKEYVVPGSTWRKTHLRAVDGVDLTVRRGEIVGLVGESGSGKSTLARCALALTDITAGSITYDGIDVNLAPSKDRRRLRREVQLVYQQPVSALDPRMSVGAQIAEPITTHRLARGAELRAQVGALLESVGLAESLRSRLPHELSGGQAQRVVIARALATKPQLLILDEPTASLDVIVQAQILNLLLELQARYGIAYLVISHDLSVVRHLSDRVSVMYLGRIVEEGPVQKLLAAPRHPYTQALVASMRGGGRATIDTPPRLIGETPPAWDVPAGCRFHPRCALYAALDTPDRCTTDDPTLEPVARDHIAACHFAADPSRAAGLVSVEGAHAQGTT
jgi:oligopeptide/dipeptide ABC transporter ATP-binding protein